MGSGFSHLIPCFKPDYHHTPHNSNAPPGEVVFPAEQPLDETLGHSFCYLRSSARFVSPTPSDRFLSPSQSFRFDDKSRTAQPETGFRSISGAAVSANTSTPRTVPSLDSIYDDATGPTTSTIVNGFDCTSSFSALPLQPVPRGDTSGFFLSGPLDTSSNSLSDTARVPFSAPISVPHKKKNKRKKSFSALYRSLSEKKRPWVVPVGRKEVGHGNGDGMGEVEHGNVQWALGKAGEDRVHVVVSEEHGWVFVGIYDGFNGPDAPEFLMGHLYRAVYNELKGLFWDIDDSNVSASTSCSNPQSSLLDREEDNQKENRRKLWEFLAEDEAEDGLDLSGSARFAFSVDDAVSVSTSRSEMSRRSLVLSKLKQGFSRTKDGHSRSLFQWRFGLEEKDKVDSDGRVEERVCRRRKTGPVDHELVLRALSQALEKTERAYLDLTDRVIDNYPELALMGSCLLVFLMRDEDVYVMNVGDSRAIVAQFEPQESRSNAGLKEEESTSSAEGIAEESTAGGGKASGVASELLEQATKLTGLQLSTDHSTSIEEEILRIKNEHPDDSQCIVNDRVKGRLKVTRAFGAGFLKQPKFNDALLEMFRNEFIGNAPYISCTPSLCHHKLGPRDQFLVLSSDGLYQYLTNQEVVSYVESFMERFPDGDPAQHLIEELLNRAAKKAGMGFHDLLDIPKGDRRRYHDDVTVMVISLEGRIWKSSGKYL